MTKKKKKKKKVKKRFSNLKAFLIINFDLI